MFDNITPEQHQNAERYSNDLQFRAQVDAKFAAQQKYDDKRHLADMGDGTQEQPRQRIQYNEKRPHSLGAFLLAFVIVIVLFVLSCPAIMAVVGWLFRL